MRNAVNYSRCKGNIYFLYTKKKAQKIKDKVLGPRFGNLAFWGFREARTLQKYYYYLIFSKISNLSGYQFQ